ncbi:hypothetical protein HRbin01_01024 [archaeon HR01]|nr:hypothetical protein HRbin01_01024 [archaeon HR01]
MHWMHLLGVVFWIGGVAYILLVLMAGLPHVALRDRARMMPILLRRFLYLVWVSVAVVAATGLYRVVFVMGITDVAALTMTRYGNLLLAKLVLVAALLAVASSVTLRVYPRTVRHLQTHLEEPADSYRCTSCRMITGSIKLHLETGLVLAAVIIFAAALLRGA